MGRYIVCFVTINDTEKAPQIARLLVEKNLVACVNIIPKILSIYRWKGQVCEDTERLLIMKTRAELFPTLQETIKEVHLYDVPEIIAVSIEAGLPAYLQWIDESTKPF